MTHSPCKYCNSAHHELSDVVCNRTQRSPYFHSYSRKEGDYFLEIDLKTKLSYSKEYRRKHIDLGVPLRNYLTGDKDLSNLQGW